MPDFSTKQYGWKDIAIVLGGRILTGATEVEYTRKKEKGVIFGRGDQGHSIGTGNETVEGKVEMWQSEYEALVRDAPNGDVLQLEVDIPICYEPKDGSPVITDIVKTAQFTEVKKGMKQGDKNQLITLPFIALRIKNQA